MDTRIADKGILKVIQKIHASPCRIVLAVTGGGSGAISKLLMHGGGSATLLEALVPYDRNALTALIGKEPDIYCSEETARNMAMVSFEHAIRLGDKQQDIGARNIIGIGVTCKLVRSKAEREGRIHEAYIASQSLLQTTTSHLTLLHKRTREEEEEIASMLIIRSLAQLCNIDIHDTPAFESVPEFSDIEHRAAKVSPDIGELLADTLLHAEKAAKRSINISHRKENKSVQPRMIFAGSFNPCHKNHAKIARTAFEMYGFPVCLEISLANVDKPPIDFISLEYRLGSLERYMSEEFTGDYYLTNAPLFADKATLFPDCCFLIGADTLNRIFNEKYYRKDETRNILLNHFKALKVRFLIFQRKNVEFTVDDDILDICRVVELSDYEDDGTSSTMIRKEK